jgi:rhodanese-related sulfurtransferase
VTVDAVPESALVLDVREPGEWQAGHIDGALHMPLSHLPRQIAADPGPLSRQSRIVVVCKVGARSAQATAWLNQHGFEAVNLDGGMLAWERAGRPMVRDGGGIPRVA